MKNSKWDLYRKLINKVDADELFYAMADYITYESTTINYCMTNVERNLVAQALNTDLELAFEIVAEHMTYYPNLKYLYKKSIMTDSYDLNTWVKELS